MGQTHSLRILTGNAMSGVQGFLKSTYKQYWRSSKGGWRWRAPCRAVYRCCPSIAGAGWRRSPDLHQRPCGSTSLSLLLLAGRLAGWLWSDMKETSVLFSAVHLSSKSAANLDLVRPLWSHLKWWKGKLSCLYSLFSTRVFINPDQTEYPSSLHTLIIMVFIL